MPNQATYRAVGYAYPTSTIAGRLGRAERGCWYHDSRRGDFLSNQDYAGPFASAAEAAAASAEAFPGLPIAPDTEAWLSDHINRSRGAPRTELTETGEQYVMPGCERAARTAGTQLGLWD